MSCSTHSFDAVLPEKYVPGFEARLPDCVWVSFYKITVPYHVDHPELFSGALPSAITMWRCCVVWALRSPIFLYMMSRNGNYTAVAQQTEKTTAAPLRLSLYWVSYNLSLTRFVHSNVKLLCCISSQVVCKCTYIIHLVDLSFSSFRISPSLRILSLRW